MSELSKLDVAACMRAAFEANQCTYVAFARLVMAAEVQMFEHVTDRLTGDPARNILLGVFAANEEGCRYTVKDATIASNVPQSTALRYIDILKIEGFLSSWGDPHDARVLLTLTDVGRARISRYLRFSAPFELVPTS